MMSSKILPRQFITKNTFIFAHLQKFTKSSVINVIGFLFYTYNICTCQKRRWWYYKVLPYLPYFQLCII